MYVAAFDWKTDASRDVREEDISAHTAPPHAAWLARRVEEEWEREEEPDMRTAPPSLVPSLLRMVDAVTTAAALPSRQMQPPLADALKGRNGRWGEAAGEGVRMWGA